ncbi:UNVERIFIED_CONTAM: Homeobox-DDT domain protein RLT2 [Sesamum radiatum]|uniref:Homeobox-DDT domain protein RLT2 n=1 Tax=Sesamum radiatum TaxID=300843 RepID=A0AAW2LLE3_SESRA
MQERGFSNPRRSRHRLTPGTVKFAAFHVLSLEGSKGLSILDVADKIQKASISAALSRDTSSLREQLRHCVRSLTGRICDAEAILSAAREKIRLYQNGNVDGEAEDVEKEDAERDQDSESDAADDPDVDDLDAISKLKEASHSSETSRLQDINCYGKGPLANHGFKDLLKGSMLILAWSALVALIGVANEGNTIRIALEERLEAANALKKQMWAEAQLDKRRMKEENTVKLHNSSLAGNRADQNAPYGAVEDRRNPLLTGDIKDVLSSTNHAVQLVDLNEQQNEQSYCSDIVSENNPLMPEFSVGSDNLLLQQSVCAAEKSRSELKALIGYQAEQLYVYRSLPLGQDRRRNRYWQFITSPSRNDPGSGRIFVELCDGAWRLIDSEEGFDALVSSLDIRGTRESHLHSMLRKIETSFKGTARKNMLCTIHPGHALNEVKKEVLEMRPKIDSYSSNDSRKSILCASYSKSPEPSVQLSNELGKNVTEENELMDRCKDVEKWMWEECFNSNKLGALNCGRLRTYSIFDQSFNFPEHVSQCKGKISEELDGVTLKFSLPPRVRLLKAQLATIEASIPSEALESVWSEEYRKSWGMKLHMASTAEELLQDLTLLENSIKKDFLSANYETTSEILSSRKIVADSFSGPEEISVLPWIPQTTSAVALQLMELDSSIYYTVHEKEYCQKDSQAGYFAKGPLRCYSLEGSNNNVSQAGYLRQDNWVSGWKGRQRGRGGRKKGRRSIRRKQKPNKGLGKNVVEKSGTKKSNFGDTPGRQQEEWNLEEIPMEVPGAENVSSSGRSEFEDDNSQASADEYDDISVDDISGVRNGKSRYFTAVDDYKVVGKMDMMMVMMLMRMMNMKVMMVTMNREIFMLMGISTVTFMKREMDRQE